MFTRSSTAVSKKIILPVLVAAALGVGLTACSSSGSSSPASPGVASGSASQGLATAEAVVAKYSKAPTTLGQTVPLKTKPTPGKTIIFLKCELPQCTEFYQGVQAAASAAGWNAKAIDFTSSDPSTFVSALQQAIGDKPVAVSFTVPPYQVWASQVAAAQRAGVALIPSYVGATPINSTIIANVAGPEHTATTGNILGNWFVSDSNGSGNALLVNVPAVGILDSISKSITSTVKANCPGCKLSELDASLSQVASNGVASAIVSQLQRSPSTKYVLLSDGAFVPGLPAALSAAGLSGIKIAGGGASTENESDLKNGTESAFVSEPLTIAGWTVVDAALRHSEGMTVTATNGGVPAQLLTKANVGTPSAVLDEPKDYADQFKRLWKVS